MSRVYVGNLDHELLSVNSRMSSVSMELSGGKNGWRVEQSHNRGERGGERGGGRGGPRGSDFKCYECGEPGHFSRECRNRGGTGRRRSRSRSRSPRYRSSPSYGRRSYSPRARSSPPRGRGPSLPPPRGRSYSRSPPYREREEVPYANGNGL